MKKAILCSKPQPESEDNSTHFINRRGIALGWIKTSTTIDPLSFEDVKLNWSDNQPILLPKLLIDSLQKYQADIKISEQLYHALLQGNEVDELFDQPTYLARLGYTYEMLSTRFDESDRQELVSVDFDVLEDGELKFEDIWVRISWLSFIESDESLRFRFSFGMEGFDDVSLDLERQLAAAKLCERLFPESALISKNPSLNSCIAKTIGVDDLLYLERIIYYNAKDGGAQFHHDAEKGHLGVVYAQLTGNTLWLALSKKQLMAEIQTFLTSQQNQEDLKRLFKDAAAYESLIKSATDRVWLASILDDPSNNEISVLLNESINFFELLVNKGYGYVLSPGDVILLPQENMSACAWHSVFCLGEKAGQALSFAIKPKLN